MGNLKNFSIWKNRLRHAATLVAICAAVACLPAAGYAQGGPAIPDCPAFLPSSEPGPVWNSLAQYATVNASDPNPGNRTGSATWTDAAGNLWLFSGRNVGAFEGSTTYFPTNSLNDVWKYDITTKQWSQIPNVGTVPPARSLTATWTDADGNFWMFGGTLHSAGSYYNLSSRNDMWKYDPVANVWTEIVIPGQDNTKYRSFFGNYSGANLYPSARNNATTWKGTDGKFYLFGGFSMNYTGSPSSPWATNPPTTNTSYHDFSDFSDLWVFDPFAKTWQLVQSGYLGGGGVAQLGTYTGSNQWPRIRSGASVTQDTDGTVYMFGGRSRSAITSEWTGLSDLWKFNVQTNQWTFIALPGQMNAQNEPQIARKTGVFTGQNQLPGGRGLGKLWFDSQNKLWLFGGYGKSTSENLGTLNDLWNFDIVNNRWTFYPAPDQTSGQNTLTATASYSGTSVRPGSVAESNAWRTETGDLMLYGGVNRYESSGLRFNDFWKLSTVTLNKKINTLKNQSANYNLAISQSVHAPVITLASTPAHGTVSVGGAPNYTVTYTPTTDYVGNDSFTYSVKGADNSCLESVSVASVKIEQPNACPTGADLTASTSENVVASLVLVAADTDAGDTLSRIISVHPVKGTLNQLPSGQVQYIPNANVNGTDTFKYKVSDGKCESPEYTVTVTIASVANCPTFPENPTTSYLGAVEKWSSVDTQSAMDNPGSMIGQNPKPGSRYQAAKWQSANGDVWLFGGAGRLEGGVGILNDFWKYNDSEAKWIFLGATGNGINQANSSANGAAFPGSRQGAASWTDNSGNLWLFGGARPNSSMPSGGFQYLSDLWKYDVSVGQWQLIPISASTINTNGVYLPDVTQYPGAREAAQTWVDSSNNLWLFGGNGFGEDGEGILNDLWKFNTNSLTWQFVNGDTFGNDPGNMTNNAKPQQPGGRYGTAGWTDSTGNLWVFGGSGYTETYDYGNLNDMWKFDVVSNAWSFRGGSGNLIEQTGDYTGSTPKPGSKYSAAAFKGTDGSFWMYGGLRGDGSITNPLGATDDLWKFNPVTEQWTVVNGNGDVNKPVNYNFTNGNPGSRIGAAAWMDHRGSIKLFGGDYINGSTESTANDVWTFRLHDGRPVIETTKNTAKEKVITFNDPDGIGTLVVVSQPSIGTVALKPGTNNTLVFTPNSNAIGEEEIQIRAEKATGNDCLPVIYPVVVKIVDTPCELASNLNAETNVNQTALIDLNIGYTGLETVTVTIVTQPTHGTASIVTGNKIQYVPSTNYIGADSINYKVNIGTCESVTRTISITVKDDNSSAIADWELF